MGPYALSVAAPCIIISSFPRRQTPITGGTGPGFVSVLEYDWLIASRWLRTWLCPNVRGEQ